MISPDLERVFQYVDDNKQKFIDHLAELVAVKSVSSWPHCRSECQRMMDIVADEITALGGSVEKCDIGMQKQVDGTEIPLPNVLLGKICWLVCWWF